jgi:cbb3-type cytochrome oxidase maturation protein
MDILIYLIPITILISILGLLAFIWSLKTKQYDDLEGSANRILFDEDMDIQDDKKKSVKIKKTKN